MSNQTSLNPPDTFEMSERKHEDKHQTSSITNNETVNLGVSSISNKMSTTNLSNLFLSNNNNNNNANQLNKSNASSKENDEDRVDDLNSLTPKVLSLNDEEIENNNNNINYNNNNNEEEDSLSKITTTTNGIKLLNPTLDKINVDLSTGSVININVENNNNNENEFELKSHEIIRTRFESDFILCIVAFVFVFALHVSTLFTVLKSFYLLDVLFLLGFIVGIFSSYIMPHLRLENPW